jgi:hypothetical protein
MKRAAHDDLGGTLLKTVALVLLVGGLLCLFHGVDHDERVGSLCAGAVLLSFVVTFDFELRPSRRSRPAPAFSLYTAILSLPDPPPKLRPA